MEQDQINLSSPNEASEIDEEEFELSPRQFFQLHFVTPKVPKQRQFETSSRPILK